VATGAVALQFRSATKTRSVTSLRMRGLIWENLCEVKIAADVSARSNVILF